MEFEKIKSIYDHLGDDTSRMIFEKRLEFSLSGDYQRINELVLQEMQRYGKLDILNRCIDWIQDSNIRKVSVFGAGFAGHQIVQMLRLHGILVERVYDNNRNRWNDQCNGVVIAAPQSVGADEYIVLGVNYQRETILQQLLTLGVKRTHIFIPDGLWWLGNWPQYFDKTILTPSASEIFIDGGSLDGGDSINFATWCGGDYDQIYAFEPDSANIERMRDVSNKISNFRICPTGLWNEKSTLRFASGVAESCAISKDGNVEVEVDSLDNVLSGQKATYIKMDIEGCELKALEGAEKTIKAFKPKLAICVYHKPEDIIDIPMKILQFNQNYKFFLRHYSYVDTETVLYAIDEEES